MTIRLLFMFALIAAFGLGPASAETLLERGDYLVNAVMGCDGCHTSRPAPDAAPARFAGGPQNLGHSVVHGEGHEHHA